MIENAENLIYPGETFIIRDALDMSKPMFATVIDEKTDQQYQRVTLRTVVPPCGGFVLNTSRRMGHGIFTNRDNRYLFLRTQGVSVEDIAQFFDSLKETPESFIKKSQELSDGLLCRI